RSSPGGCLSIEQNAQAAEHRAARIVKWDVVRAFKILLFEIKLGFANHNLQVLLNLLLLSLGCSGLELCEHRLSFPPLLIFISQSRLRGLRIKLAQTLLRTELRTVLHLNRQEHVRIVVANGDPTWR